MSQMPLDDLPRMPDPERILRRLPEAERERFLSEYRTALDAAHEVWRYRHLQELLARWELVATATSKPGYAQAREEVRTGAGQYVSLEDVIARRQRQGA
jgi:hypothetical protein